MSKTIKICVSSLGCAKNLVDTEVMLGTLAKNGVQLTNDLNQADIYVVNTCSFIESAREESNGAIADAVKWKKKKRHRKVVVAGCLPQRDPEKVKETHPNVDLFLGIDEVPSIAVMIENLMRKLPNVHKIKKEDLPVYLYDEETPRLLVTPQHYAYIKISEGCNHKCSFCAIPTFRGKLRSRTISSLVKEAQALLNQGVRELILVSQDSTGYGSDLDNDTNTAELLKALDGLDCGEYWVRLLYLYPTTVSEDLIDVFANAKHLVRYIDMPLQHASNDVLKTMRRGITRPRTEDLLGRFRSKVDGVTMRTTFLVGHPGETEKDFQELCDFVSEQRFDRFGVFTYSHEENTHAFGMENDVPAEIAEARKNELMRIQSEISLEKNQQLVGKTVRCIIDDVFEDEDGETHCIGRTAGDAPDVDNLVRFPFVEGVDGLDFVDVKIDEAEHYDLWGEAVIN